MRYAQDVKENVRVLRKQGRSLGEIYTVTHIPKTTIRLWIKDIVLGKKQLQVFKDRVNDALQKGRVRVQKAASNMRQKEEKKLFEEAEQMTQHLTDREFFSAGIALYWGEGFKNKHEHRLGFCNSDPFMINFYIKWLEKFAQIKRDDLTARLTLNSSYKERSKEIEAYWSTLTGIPLSHFTKTFYQYSSWKKQYKTDEYRGVLRIHVKNSLKQLWQMKGWIAGLKHAKIVTT